MNIPQSLSDRSFLYAIDALNEKLEAASAQVASGKRLSHLKDSPADSAELVGLRAELSQIDQYRTNTDNSSFFVGLADSVLSSVNDLVTSIFAKGSLAANGTTTSSARAALAGEIRSLRDSLLAHANTEARGRFIFAGSKVTTTPFTISADAVSYQGDAETNQLEISDGLHVQQGLAGSEVFEPVFSVISDLLAGIESGNTAEVAVTLNRFSSVMSGVNQYRGQLGFELAKLQNVQGEHDTQETAVRTRISHVEDANLAEAITQLQQIQTALEASLAAHASVRRRTLFDFIG